MEDSVCFFTRLFWFDQTYPLEGAQDIGVCWFGGSLLLFPFWCQGGNKPRLQKDVSLARIRQMQGIDETFISVPVSCYEGELFASLRYFGEQMLSACDHGKYAVTPSFDQGLCYLQFATQIYSKLVMLDRPCVDVVVRRRDDVQSELKTSVLEPPLPDSEDPGEAVRVDSSGDSSAEGSIDFYNKYGVVAVGGTFDRMHAGHRLLLTVAAWATRQKLRLGVTSEVLLKGKKFREVIASFDDRSTTAKEFALRVKPTLPEIVITELKDPAGPTATDPSIEAIVVSKETAAGARAINERRLSAGLPSMAIIEVDVLDAQGKKLSSTALREEAWKNRNSCTT